MFNSQSGFPYSLADIAAVTGGSRSNNDGFGDGNGWWIIILLLLFGWGNGGYGGFGGGNGGGSVGEGQLTRAALYDGFTTNGIERSLASIQAGMCDGFYAMNNGMLTGFNGTNIALMQGQNALATQLADCCCTTKGAIQQAAFDNLQGQNAITRQIADCCCETGRQIERGFADVNYNMATNANMLQTSLANSTRDIIDSQNASTRAILDYLCQEKIADLQSENQSLRLAASQQAQNAFITANQEAQTAEIIRRLGRDNPIPAYMVPNPNCCYTPSFTSCGNCGCGC